MSSGLSNEKFLLVGNFFNAIFPDFRVVSLRPQFFRFRPPIFFHAYAQLESDTKYTVRTLSIVSQPEMFSALVLFVPPSIHQGGIVTHGNIIPSPISSDFILLQPMHLTKIPILQCLSSPQELFVCKVVFVSVYEKVELSLRAIDPEYQQGNVAGAQSVCTVHKHVRISGIHMTLWRPLLQPPCRTSTNQIENASDCLLIFSVRGPMRVSSR